MVVMIEIEQVYAPFSSGTWGLSIGTLVMGVLAAIAFTALIIAFGLVVFGFANTRVGDEKKESRHRNLAIGSLLCALLVFMGFGVRGSLMEDIALKNAVATVESHYDATFVVDEDMTDDDNAKDRVYGTLVSEEEGSTPIPVIVRVPKGEGTLSVYGDINQYMKPLTKSGYARLSQSD